MGKEGVKSQIDYYANHHFIVIAGRLLRFYASKIARWADFFLAQRTRGGRTFLVWPGRQLLHWKQGCKYLNLLYFVSLRRRFLCISGPISLFFMLSISWYGWPY